METKDDQTVARRAVAAAPPSGGRGDAAPGVQDGKAKRRKDEITLRVPNPFFTQPEAPAPVALPEVDPASPHSAPTAKLKVSSLVWDEYSSMPLTPAPVSEGQDQPAAGSPGSDLRPKGRRGLMIALVIVIIGAGALVGALLPTGNRASRPDPQPEREPQSQPVGTPEKTLEVQQPPVATPPAPSGHAKRRVSVTVEPAEATLDLDGRVVGKRAIALELVQDKASHVVQASAPGYLPFKRTFTLENDLNLRISLRRAAAPARGGHAKIAAPRPVAQTPEIEPHVSPSVEPVEDFGMDMNRPAVRRQNKMDEKDPYSP